MTLNRPGRYYIAVRVDRHPVEGAIEFHVLPLGGGALRDEQDIAAEADRKRVDWAHNKVGEPTYWIADISEYCPVLDDGKKSISAAIRDWAPTFQFLVDDNLHTRLSTRSSVSGNFPLDGQRWIHNAEANFERYRDQEARRKGMMSEKML